MTTQHTQHSAHTKLQIGRTLKKHQINASTSLPHLPRRFTTAALPVKKNYALILIT
jgi:hypothetical protein